MTFTDRNTYRVPPMLEGLRSCRQCHSCCHIARSLSDRYCHWLRRTLLTLAVWTGSHNPLHRKHTSPDKDEISYHCIYHFPLVTFD